MSSSSSFSSSSSSSSSLPPSSAIRRKTTRSAPKPSSSTTSKTSSTSSSTIANFSKGKFIPVSPQEIAERSILTKNKKLKTGFEKVAGQAVSRVGPSLIGDALNDDKRNESLSHLKTFEIWKWLVEGFKNNVNGNEKVSFDGILRGLDGLLEYCSSLERIVDTDFVESLKTEAQTQGKKIEGLSAGESFTFMSAWGGVGTSKEDALIYVITRQQNNQFSLSIYPSTELPITDTLIDGYEKRLAPSVHYQNIPEEILLFKERGRINPCFIECLIEMTKKGTASVSDSYVDGVRPIVYALHFIEEYRISSETIHEQNRSAGKTGLPKAIKAWIRSQCSAELYKRMMLEFKIKIAVETYHSLEATLNQDTPEADLDRRLLKQMATKILIRNGKTIEQYDVLVQEARATAQDILNRVNAFEEEVETQRKNAELPSDVELTETDSQITSRKNINLNFNLRVRGEDFQKVTLPAFPLIDQNAPATSFIAFCSETKEQLDSLGNLNNKRNDTLVNYRVHAFKACLDHFVSQLSLEPTFWESFTKEELKESVQLLIQIVETMKASTYMKEKYSLAEVCATFFPIYAVVHLLCVKIEEKTFNEVGKRILFRFSVPTFFSELTREGLQFLDIRQFDRLESALNYLRKSAGKEIFSSEKKLNRHCLTARLIEEAFASNNNFHLWEALLGSNPDFNAYVEGKVEERFKRDEIAHHANPRLKSMLLLQEFNQGESLLSDTDYGYINDFRFMLVFARELFLSTDRDTHFIESVQRKVRFFNEGGFEYVEVESTLNPFQDSNSFTREKIRAIPIPDNSTYEAEHLKTTSSESLEKRIARPLNEWKLSPSQIFFQLMQEMEALSTPALQKKVFNYLFRSLYTNGKKLKLGIGSRIAEDPALFENAKTFINKGMAYFQEKENLSGVFFFLELSFYLSKYLADTANKVQSGQDAEYLKGLSNQLNKTEAIKALFSKKGVSEVDKSALCFYSLLYFSIKPQEELDTEDYQTIFSLLAAHQLASISREQVQAPFSIDLVNSFIFSLTAKIFDPSSDSTLISQIGNSICGFLELENSETEWHLADEGAPYITNGLWKIDVVRGKVYGNAGELRLARNKSWEREDNFKKIFGESPAFFYQIEGNTRIRFSDTKHRMFSLVIPENQYYPYRIQRKIDGQEKWFEYVHHTDSLNLTSILHGNAYWAPVESFSVEINRIKVKGLITDIKSGNIIYAVLANGEVVNADKETGAPDLDGPRINFLVEKRNTDFLKGIKRFDAPENVITFHRQQQLTEVVFSRYSSFDGKPLMFTLVEGKLVFLEDRGYYLPKRMPVGLLGTTPNYLYLQSTKSRNKGMIVVPFQKIKDSSTLTIENEDSVWKAEPVARIAVKKVDQSKLHRYFTYQVVDRQLIPSTTESKLFLAYIYLSQMKSEEATAILKGVKPTESITPTALLILEMIQKLPASDSKSSALKAHALVLVLRQKDLISNEKVEKYFEKKELIDCLSNFVTIIKSLQNLPEEFHLNKEDEIYLLEIFIKEAKDHCLKTTEERSFNRSKETKVVDYDLFKKVEELEERLAFLKQMGGPVAEVGPIENSILLNRTETIQSILNDDGYQKFKDANTPKYTKGTNYSAPKLIEDPIIGQMQRFLYVTRENIPPQEIIESWSLLPAVKDAIGVETSKRVLLYKLNMWKLWFPNSVYLDFMTVRAHRNHFPYSVNRNKDIQNLTDWYSEFRHEVKSGNVFLTKPKTLPSPQRKEIEYGVPVENEERSFNTVLASQEERWDFLTGLKEEFLYEIPSLEERSNTIDQHPPTSPQDSNYTNVLAQDLEEFIADCEEGKRVNQATQQTISSDNCKKLHEQIEGQRLAKNRERIQKMDSLLALVNKNSNEISRCEVELSRTASGLVALISYEDCIQAILANDATALSKRNPNLEQDDLDAIAALVIEIADSKSYEKQLKRISSYTQKIQQIQDAEDPTRRYLCQCLAQELSAKTFFDGFDQEQQVTLRIFSGQSGIIPFKKQTDLLKKMLTLEETNPSRFQDIVIQLIMGGGKTSVIATILLQLSSQRKGRLACFIVPPALFQTVAANLSESMKAAFGKTLIPLNIPRQRFVRHHLEQLRTTIETALRRQQPLIVTPTTLQGLGLQLLSLTRQFATVSQKLLAVGRELERAQEERKSFGVINSLGNRRHTLLEKQELLAREAKLIFDFIKMTKMSADALIDEVDLILDSAQELNFVDGKKVHVTLPRNLLLMEIFKCLTSNKRVAGLTNAPTISQLVKLQSNQQHLLKQETYQQFVAPLIAAHVFDNFNRVNDYLPDDYRQSFIRYATGKIPVFVQEFATNHQQLSREEAAAQLGKQSLTDAEFESIKSDLAFVNYIKGMHQSHDEEVKEAANLIALAKHFILDLLPSTLSKTGGRHYGPSPDLDKTGKIVPYLAVNTPATTEFGYHWEAACYQYQWGTAFNPTREEILKIAKENYSRAMYYVQEKGEVFEHTAEYEDFMEIFGVHLGKIEEPGVIEHAIGFVSRASTTRIQMQFEHVASLVTYASERLTSNGLDLVDLCASTRAMSGTPWNAKGYRQSLAKNIQADLGTEGCILDKLLERASPDKIVVVDFQEESTPISVMKFFENIWGSLHQGHRNIRGIIETGGLFKIFKNNEAVAKGWLEFIEKKQGEQASLSDQQKTVDPAIEGVLFFHQGLGENQPNTLYVWKKGSTEPERLAGSSIESLEAHGLSPENYVVYYDERHTTGTDIRQLPNAVNLITFDEKTKMRTLTQGVMRLRQFRSEQDVVFVVSTETEKIFAAGEGLSVDAFIRNAHKVQSIHRANAMVRHFVQQIRHLPRQEAIKNVLSALENTFHGGFREDFIQTVRDNETHFVNRMEENPFLQHSSIQGNVETKEMLIALVDKEINAFSRSGADQQSIEQFNAKADEMKAWIRMSNCFPTTQTHASSPIGIEQEIEQEVEQEVNVEVEVAQDIDDELNRYNRIRIGPPLLEERGKPDSGFLVSLLRADTIDSRNSSICHLSAQMEKYQYGKRYQNIFQEPIFGTHHYFYTHAQEGSQNDELTLPVFHQCQRPANQILAVRDSNGNIRWLLLSEFQAGQMRKHLEEQYADAKANHDVWLIQPDGSLLVAGGHSKPFPAQEEQIRRGLVEINAFNGNISFFNKQLNRMYFTRWIKDNSEFKIRFLSIKTKSDPKQHALFKSNSTLIQVSRKDDGEIEGQFIYQSKRRQERENAYTGNYDPGSELATKCLTDANKIQDLRIERVKYLGIDENNLSDELKRRLKRLYPQHPAIEAARLITKHQFQHLQPYQVPHLTPDQMKWLPVGLVPHLSNGEQIQKIEGGRIEYMLSEQQALALTTKQRKLIPFVNPEFYKNFVAKGQVRAIPVELIMHINESKIGFLSPDQIKNLPLNSEDARLGCLKIIAKFSEDQCRNIHGNFIRDIPGKYQKNISPEQIEEITDPSLIKDLEGIARSSEVQEGLWTSWISLEMVPHVSDDRVKYLVTKEQIQKVNLNQVHLLTTNPDQDQDQDQDQVKYITKDQVPHLVGKAQIQACPNGLVPNLSREQVPMVSALQVPSLLREQVDWITWDQVPSLERAEQIQACPNRLVPNLSQQQVPSLLPKQVGSIKWGQVPFLDGEAQIQACPNGLVPNLSQAQVPMVSAGQVPSLSRKQVKWIKLEQVPFLDREAQIQACPNGLVPNLSAQQVPMVSAKQVEFVNSKLIDNIKRELVPNLSPEQIEVFGAQGYNRLDDQHPLWGRIDEAQEGIIAGLEVDKVHKISKEQFKYLKNDGAIKSISKWDFTYLTKEQLKHRKEELGTYILGVWTLGLCMSIISIFGYLFIPVVWVFSTEGKRKYKASLDNNVYRMVHFFTEFIPGTRTEDAASAAA